MPRSENLADVARDLLAQPTAAANYNRRMLDPCFDGTGALTITLADLADAVRRTLQCAAPAITQGVWAVLRSEAQRRANTAEDEHLTRVDADRRAQRQRTDRHAGAGGQHHARRSSRAKQRRAGGRRSTL